MVSPVQTSAITLSPAVLSCFAEAAEVLKPPPKMTVSQWAEANRVLSTESSSTTGYYRCAPAPYQRAMMDAVNLPGVEQIVFFTGAQLGKSLVTENIAAYFVAEDPCPMIWMWPNEDTAKNWSVDTLAPMLRDTPALTRLVEEGARKSTNRALFKKFPGGFLAIIGANAPAGLRRRRARLVIADEVDGYPPSAGAEGDPITLVSQRSVTFWNALQILASTCTLENASRIEAAYQLTNMQRFWVPCPHCNEFQVLKWKQITYPKNEEPTIDNVSYACEHCGAALDEFDKPRMLSGGEWRAEHPEITKAQGFWISGLYSPFETWAKLAARWRAAMEHRENPNLLKAFVNLVLAETWSEKDDRLDKQELITRAEDYPRSSLNTPLLPDGVTVLTAGADVQPDRIELELVGWGKGEESWSIDWVRFDGDTARPDVWAKLDEYLARWWMHARGPRLPIARLLIDSGYNAAEVYRFCKARWPQVAASKGSSDFGHPPLKKWNQSNKGRVRLYPVGVSQIKLNVYKRLKLTDPGYGYLHFSKDVNDAEYFNQLVAEELRRKYENGFPKLFWAKLAGARNEALDCRVYAYAAFLSLSENPQRMIERLREDLLAEAKAIKAKNNPNQMALPAVGEELPPVDEPEVAPSPSAESVAAATDDKNAASSPTPSVNSPAQHAPQIRFRRSGWI